MEFPAGRISNRSGTEVMQSIYNTHKNTHTYQQKKNTRENNEERSNEWDNQIVSLFISNQAEPVCCVLSSIWKWPFHNIIYLHWTPFLVCAGPAAFVYYSFGKGPGTNNVTPHREAYKVFHSQQRIYSLEFIVLCYSRPLTMRPMDAVSRR